VGHLKISELTAQNDLSRAHPNVVRLHGSRDLFGARLACFGDPPGASTTECSDREERSGALVAAIGNGVAG
jgi:hypothetical protein